MDGMHHQFFFKPNIEHRVGYGWDASSKNSGPSSRVGVDYRWDATIYQFNLCL